MRDFLQIERINGVPLLLQPVRTGGNPDGCSYVFHGLIITNLLYICTVQRY